MINTHCKTGETDVAFTFFPHLLCVLHCWSLVAHGMCGSFFYQGGNTQVAYRSGVPLFVAAMPTYGWKPDEKHAIAFPDEGQCKQARMFVLRLQRLCFVLFVLCL